MALTKPINIRLSAEKRFLYETEAAYRGQSLGVYLRERLEKSEPSFQELQKIHDLIKNITSPSSSNDQGILLETLLLLRYLSSPEKMLIVQKELSRLNIQIWQGESCLSGKRKVDNLV